MNYIITITKCEYDWQIPFSPKEEVYRQTIEDLDVPDAIRRINAGSINDFSSKKSLYNVGLGSTLTGRL